MENGGEKRFERSGKMRIVKFCYGNNVLACRSSEFGKIFCFAILPHITFMTVLEGRKNNHL